MMCVSVGSASENITDSPVRLLSSSVGWSPMSVSTGASFILVTSKLTNAVSASVLGFVAIKEISSLPYQSVSGMVMVATVVVELMSTVKSEFPLYDHVSSLFAYS